MATSGKVRNALDIRQEDGREALGEMSRTPQANAAWGRGHWSTFFPGVVAGAGVRGGTLYGASDKDAAYATERPWASTRIYACTMPRADRSPWSRAANRSWICSAKNKKTGRPSRVNGSAALLTAGSLPR